MSEIQTKLCLAWFIARDTVPHTTAHRYRKYQVISFNLDIFESASNLRTQYHLSFWDSLVIACTLFSDANILYSEDMQDGLIVDKKLTIINPFKQ